MKRTVYVILSVVFFVAFIWATLYFNPSNVTKRAVKAIIAQGDSSIIVSFLSGKYPQLKEYADTAAQRSLKKTNESICSWSAINAFRTIEKNHGPEYAAGLVFETCNSKVFWREEHIPQWNLQVDNLEAALSEAMKLKIIGAVMSDGTDFFWLNRIFSKTKMEYLCLDNLQSNNSFPSERFLALSADSALVQKVVGQLSDKAVIKHRLIGKVSDSRRQRIVWSFVKGKDVNESIDLFRSWNMPAADFMRMLDLKNFDGSDIFHYYQVGLISKDYLLKRLVLLNTKFLYLWFRDLNDHDVNHRFFEIMVESVKNRADLNVAETFFREQNEPDWVEILELKNGHLNGLNSSTSGTSGTSGTK